MYYNVNASHIHKRPAANVLNLLYIFFYFFLKLIIFPISVYNMFGLEQQQK